MQRKDKLPVMAIDNRFTNYGMQKATMIGVIRDLYLSSWVRPRQVINFHKLSRKKEAVF